MRAILIILFCTAVSTFCSAQQEPQFTMYWNNYSLQNPAATGLFYKQYASVSGRNQWVGFPGNPQTISMLYDYKLTKIKSGVGINCFANQQGLEKNKNVNINYSYHIQFKRGSILSTGIAIGVLQKTIDYSHVILSTPDPLIPASTMTGNIFNINAGMMYKTQHFLLGLGVTQLNEGVAKKLSFQNTREFFATSSYTIFIAQYFSIKPSFYLKSARGGTTSLDINLLTTYDNKYWVGLTYRTSDAVAVMAGIDIKGKYRIGYSYDYTTSEMKNYSWGSHEVVLAFMFAAKPVTPESTTP
jgi:type IX secretion system PorP/SprF family membrane protein